MEVQHTRSGDTGAESVVYTYLLNRGCSEERHYGTESVKSKYNPVEIGHESGYRACFCSSRSESSRDDCTSFKHNPRGKDNCLQSQPAAFGMVHKDQIWPFCPVYLLSA